MTVAFGSPPHPHMPAATPTPRRRCPALFGRRRASVQPNALAPSARQLARPVEVYGALSLSLADRRDVLQAELDRVDPELLGQGVDHLLERPVALRVARRPERPRLAGVDEDVRGLELHVGAGVEVADAGTPSPCRRSGRRRPGRRARDSSAVSVPSCFAPALSVIALLGRLPATRNVSSRVRSGLDRAAESYGRAARRSPCTCRARASSRSRRPCSGRSPGPTASGSLSAPASASRIAKTPCVLSRHRERGRRPTARPRRATSIGVCICTGVRNVISTHGVGRREAGGDVAARGDARLAQDGCPSREPSARRRRAPRRGRRRTAAPRTRRRPRAPRRAPGRAVSAATAATSSPSWRQCGSKSRRQRSLAGPGTTGSSAPGDSPVSTAAHAGHRLGLRGVDPLDPGVRVRAADDRRVQHARAAGGRGCRRPTPLTPARRRRRAAAGLPTTFVSPQGGGVDAPPPAPRIRSEAHRAHRPPPLRASAARRTALTMCGVGAAAAQVAAHPEADLGDGRRRLRAQQALGRHDLSRRAVAALERVLVGERLLDRPQLLAAHQALDGRDLVALGLERERQAGVARHAVDQHRAGAALAALAAGLGAGQAEPLAEDVEQRPARLDEQPVAPAVDEERDLGRLDRVGDLWGCRLARPAERRGGDRAGAQRAEEAAPAHPVRAGVLVVSWFPGHDDLHHAGVGGNDVATILLAAVAAARRAAGLFDDPALSVRPGRPFCYRCRP